MLNKIYIHYITTLFVLESFIISCWLLKGKKNRYRNRPVCSKKIGIGIGIGQFARKKSVSESESASLLEKNRYRNRPRKIMISASLKNILKGSRTAFLGGVFVLFSKVRV